MFGFRTSGLTITDATEVVQPSKIIAYNFRNYGNN